MAPRIAVMHHPRSFFAMELYEQLGGAANLLWVLSSPERSGLTEPRLLNRLGTVVDIAGMGPDQAAETLGAHGPDGIVSFVDEHIEDVTLRFAAAGYVALIGNTDGNDERERMVFEQMRARRIDGLAIATARLHHPLLAEARGL